MSENNNNTHFGFKTVTSNIKKLLVNEVFTNVASKYDLMNDVMSLGMHRLWKQKFCAQISNLNSHILDVASGSGDIAFILKDKARVSDANLHITLCDINEDMLQLARDKAVNLNHLDDIKFVKAEAEQLPFPNNSFDYYTIAFGIRNVTNINKALQEALRVLKPGGKFLCLEFSKFDIECLKPIYDFYLLNIIPKIGKIITNHQEAYEYLGESIKMFPDQDTFTQILSDNGFQKTTCQNLNYGIAAIYKGYKTLQ